MKNTLRILSLVLVLLMMVPAVMAEEAPAVEEPAITLPAAELCELCGKEHIILPCGAHPGCDEEITEESYASHMLMPCGDHYYCSHEGDAEMHETKGARCELYMCHNIGATYHTRCRHCGGPLCMNRHGRDRCYDFGYKFESMYIPGPVAPQTTDGAVIAPDTTPDTTDGSGNGNTDPDQPYTT